MKLVIELEDVALRQAIESQVSKAVAELTTEAIVAKADEIITKKFERFDFYQAVAAQASSKLDDAIKQELDRVLGARFGSSRYDEIRRIIHSAATNLIKGAAS